MSQMMILLNGLMLLMPMMNLPKLVQIYDGTQATRTAKGSYSQNSDDLYDLLDSNDPVFYLDDLRAKEISMSPFDDFKDVPISKFDVTNRESDEDSHGSCSEDSNDFYIVEDDPETSD